MDGKMPIKDKPLAFVDVETTGLQSGYHEIIEICICTPKRTYHEKIIPAFPSRIDSAAVAVNGYSEKKWFDAIEGKHAAGEIADILKGHIIVGHNPHFDVDFIEDLCWRNKVELRVDRRLIDTQTLAYVYLVPLGLKSISMDNIRRFLGWEVREHHNAYDDVIDTKRLYQTLCSPWERLKIRALNWLWK